jgi:adhesin transport system membrane fusion protein
MSEAAAQSPDAGERPAKGQALARQDGPGLPAEAGGAGRPPAKRPATPARYVEFLPDVEAVSNRRHSPYARWIVITIALVFGVAVAWAAVAEIETYATANGQVRPSGRVKVVNHPFGGTVSEVLVEEGDRVEQDQVLFRLDPEFVTTEMSGIRTQWLTAIAAIARLEAEAAGAEAITFPDPVLDEAPEIAATQLDLFEARLAALRTERRRAEEIVNQRREAIALIDSQIEKLQRSLAIVSEQERAVASLVEEDYFPRLRYLSLQREVQELQSDVASAQSERLSAESALAQAMEERTAIDESWQSDVFATLAEQRANAENLMSQLAMNQTEAARLTIRAPEAGIVQNLIVTNAGQSIAPNEPLMNIVPIGDSLIIEASVTNEDIGFVEIGMPAVVKVLTYDFSTYGTLEGEVTEIAPDATVDPDTGAAFFKVWITTDRTYLGDQPGQYPVLPGMQTMVDLLTGERTILAYLTQRITSTTGGAFSER